MSDGIIVHVPPITGGGGGSGPQGPEGPQGPPGPAGASNLINFVYNTGPEPPSAGQARMNSGFPWGATTKLWVRFVSADDQDVYWGIMLVEAGSTILLQDKDSHASYVLFEVTAKPVDKGLYAEIAVIHRSNGNSINTAAPIILQRNPSTALLIEGLEALTRRVEALEKGKPKP